MSRELDAVLEVVRKSYPRPKRAFQRELASLEELKRKGEWMRVLALAEKLSAARPDLVLPARIRREAHRELGRAETDRRRSPEEESRHSAKIADELKMFLVAEPESSDRVGSVPLSQGTVPVTDGSSEAIGPATVRGDAESAPAKRGRSGRLGAVPEEEEAPSSGTLLARSLYPVSIASVDGPPTAVTRNPVATFSPGRHEVTLLAPDVFLNQKFEVGRIVGTVHYMSPEQAEGRAVDHRSDIFSLGVILFEMMTGTRPFRGDTPTSVLSSILKDTPPAAAELNPEAPLELSKLIKRCLAKGAEDRLQSAKDLRNQRETLKGVGARWQALLKG